MNDALLGFIGTFAVSGALGLIGYIIVLLLLWNGITDAGRRKCLYYLMGAAVLELITAIAFVMLLPMGR